MCTRPLLLAQLLTQQENGEPYRFVDLAFPIKDSSGKLLGVLGGASELGLGEPVDHGRRGQ